MNIESIKNNKNIINESLNKAKENQEKYNSFVTIIDNPENTNKGELEGIPYALKDNVSTSGILTTASSNILSNYIPVYDATVYKKLKESGAVLIGKTVMDELAMGGTGTTGHTGIVHNPYDMSRMVGGSSSGSATAVALGIVPFSIGTDTGDSIRKPASYVGVAGYKPTYGRVSRYGIIPYSSSLDHVGVISTNVNDIAIVMDVIKGHDKNDMTSLKDESIKYVDYLNNDIKNKKLFYIKEMLEVSTTRSDTIEIINNFKLEIEKLRKLGFIVEEVSIDKKLLKSISPAYKIISCAESTSNNANLTGIAFGLSSNESTYEKRVKESRTKGFSELIKRRFILGSYVLKKENQELLFNQAGRVRRMIVDKMNELFKNYDAYICPTTATIAPLFDEKIDTLSDLYLLLDSSLIIANFGGYPSITIPSKMVENMPTGLSITCPIMCDKEVLNIANIIEKSDINV